MHIHINVESIKFQLLNLCTAVQVQLLDDPGLFFWEVISDYFPGEDSDVQFWWHTTGLPLARMLSKASYTIELQIHQLLFYRFYVAPELGVGPNDKGAPSRWKSFMTDNHTPVEFSWDWGRGKDEPTIRYSIEPISFGAGTSSDPFNEYATDRVVQSLQKLFPNVDLAWFYHFSEKLLAFDKPNRFKNPNQGFLKSWGKDYRLPLRDYAMVKAIRQIAIALNHIIWKGSKTDAVPATTRFSRPGHRKTTQNRSQLHHQPSMTKLTDNSRSFLAFDIYPGSVVVKAYFMPTSLAFRTAQNPLDLLTNSISTLVPSVPNTFPAFPLLHTYITKHPIGSTLKLEILSVDCVSPSENRIKIYLRTHLTSFSSVRNIMTLGNLQSSSDHTLKRGLDELEKLWKLVLGTDNLRSDDELQSLVHRTAGVLYYFEIRAGQEFPVAKVYIPVRHYGKSDLATLEGLGRYLRGRGQGPWFERFKEMINSVWYVAMFLFIPCVDN